MTTPSRDRRGSNKENITPSPPYPPGSPSEEEEQVFADDTPAGPDPLDRFVPGPVYETPQATPNSVHRLLEQFNLMPPTTPSRAGNPGPIREPEPDTPELTEEGDSDGPHTEEADGVEVIDIDNGEEDEEEGEEEEEEGEEEPDYCKPTLPLPPHAPSKLEGLNEHILTRNTPQVRDDNDPTLHGLRNINALASWHVSTYKPTCGVADLLFPSVHRFWQSDGPQPHTLTIHFFKTVHILKFRLLLDWKRDESYTPTKMQFLAGTGGHDLCEFGTWEGEKPRGWMEVDMAGQGRNGGDGIWCMLVQVLVLENHQNGKDTHVRGCQVFGADERVANGRDREEGEGGAGFDEVWKMGGSGEGVGKGKSLFDLMGLGGDDEPDWMKEPQIR